MQGQGFSTTPFQHQPAPAIFCSTSSRLCSTSLLPLKLYDHLRRWSTLKFKLFFLILQLLRFFTLVGREYSIQIAAFACTSLARLTANERNCPFGAHLFHLSRQTLESAPTSRWLQIKEQLRQERISIRPRGDEMCPRLHRTADSWIGWR